MSNLRLLQVSNVDFELISSNYGTHEDSVLIEFTAPTSSTPNEVDVPPPSQSAALVYAPSLPPRLGPPLPIELVNMITIDLKHKR